MENSAYLNERQVLIIREQFQKSVEIFGTQVVYKVFDYVKSEQDPLYGGRGKDELVYRTSHKIYATVELDPSAWSLTPKGKETGVDIVFVIPSKTMEDLRVVPESGRDKIEYNGVEYTIVDIDVGILLRGNKSIALKFLCKG